VYNGIYSESALPDNHSWTPGIGYTQLPGNPIDAGLKAAAAEQAKTLDGLEKYAAMANRLDAMIDAYDDDANAIAASHVELNMAAYEHTMLVDGVPAWWKAEIELQREARKQLVTSLRYVANRIASDYGVR
jgi:hypothetical protein